MANDIGQAYVQIIPSMSPGGEGSISKLLNGAAGGAGDSAGKTIVSKIKGVIATAGIGAALVKTIQEGARYEQALGGIQTLFDGYAEEMIANANNAYKIGLSANSYMEQSTSFAAALKQTLGDSAKAGEAADLAVQSMADNSAKLGTDITSIQTAYQGFAKQNYTMLDNLKLGYGGTKTEMERLIADASTMTTEMDALGVTVDSGSMSFDNIINAIAVMQEHLGIAGVAAEEAQTTLSGSFQAMQAAASNFMSQLTTGGDITQALADLTNTATTFLIGNLLPALGKVVAAIPSVLIGLISETLPNIFDNLSGLLDGMLSEQGMEAAGKFGESFGSNILSALGKLIPSMLGFFLKLVVSLPRIATKAAVAFGKALMDKIITKVKELIEKIKKAFKFEISLPKIKLPHFSVTPSGWKLSDLLDGVIPKLSIKWYAKGGLYNRPTVLLPGVGDAGLEANIPLTGRAMQPFAKAIAENMNKTGTVYNFGDITLDAKSLEDVMTVQDFVNRLTRAKAFV